MHFEFEWLFPDAFILAIGFDRHCFAGISLGFFSLTLAWGYR